MPANCAPPAASCRTSCRSCCAAASTFESDQKGFGEALAKARTLFSVVYQPAEDDRATASLLRLSRRNVQTTV